MTVQALDTNAFQNILLHLIFISKCYCYWETPLQEDGGEEEKLTGIDPARVRG